MRATEARLIRLEGRRPKGCPTCVDWSPETWEVVFEHRDGSAARAEPGRPDACPDCGRWTPPLQRNVIVFRQREDGPQ